jgi:mono/diheme cytochrome c family protein
MGYRWPFALIALLAALVGGARADTDFDRIQRGKYLTAAGDCYACHTPSGGKPFQGGRPIETPFGVIYSANITPDRETGIGAWSDDDFYRAMHEGIAADGSRLYPAFPYPYYAHVRREDVDAIRAYLNTLEPVSKASPRNQLPFPLSQRSVLRAWNWMFFKDETFQSDPNKSAEWNRGAYLVEGLGHCGACHTPKNFLGGDKRSQAFQGADLQNWFAPNLGPDLRDGLGSWSEQDIVEYLKTGRNKRNNSTGPMSEVIVYSTSQLSDEDVRAMATYLKDLPNQKQDSSARNGGETTGSSGAPSISGEVAKAGEAIFVDQCAACHRIGGAGEPTYFPPLKGNAAVQQRDPTTTIRVILQGARSTATAARPTPLSMPAFNWKLTDAQIAAVASYVRNNWGNTAPAVTPDQVKDLRAKLHAKPQ